MLVVAALGGNALLERHQVPDADVQQAHVRQAVEALVPIARTHQLLVTHGNGPQVGVLAAESAADRQLTRPYPLDVAVAQTQGMIGYWLLQALDEALPDRCCAAVLCRTLVSGDDPAFRRPTKFVGPRYGAEEARRLAAARGWALRPDGDGWRRVVPSPRPRQVLELPAIRALLDAGAVVVGGGGGGVPVVRDADGRTRGAEGVVDKDLTAALVAEQLGAGALLLLTDVPAVELAHGTPAARPVGRTTVADLRRHRFPAGSMGPKVEAACRFVTATGGRAVIGALTQASAMLAGTAGTVVEPVGGPVTG